MTNTYVTYESLSLLLSCFRSFFRSVALSLSRVFSLVLSFDLPRDLMSPTNKAMAHMIQSSPLVHTETYKHKTRTETQNMLRKHKTRTETQNTHRNMQTENTHPHTIFDDKVGQDKEG